MLEHMELLEQGLDHFQLGIEQVLGKFELDEVVELVDRQALEHMEWLEQGLDESQMVALGTLEAEHLEQEELDTELVGIVEVG